MSMFDSRDIEEYRSPKAPEGLLERILADSKANQPKQTQDRSQKKARVIGKNAWFRSVSAVAACFIFAVTLSFLFRNEPSDFYISVGGENLDKAGETVYVKDKPSMLVRTTDEPMGIPIVIRAKETVTLTVTNGNVWTDLGDDSEKCILPHLANAGDTLYWVPDAGANASHLTLTADGKSVTYTVNGENPADMRIMFEK